MALFIAIILRGLTTNIVLYLTLYVYELRVDHIALGTPTVLSTYNVYNIIAVNSTNYLFYNYPEIWKRESGSKCYHKSHIIGLF